MPADEPFDDIFVRTHTLRDRHKHTHTHILTYAHFQAKSVVFNFLGTPVQSYRTYGKITIFVIWRSIK